jgi:hypothetical protein
MDLATSVVTTLAGVAGASGRADGIGSAATFYSPGGVGIDALGTVALVADSLNHLIRRIVISSGVVSTIAGQGGVTGTSDGLGTTASFFCRLAPR